jgi:hypothetical protein
MFVIASSGLRYAVRRDKNIDLFPGWQWALVIGSLSCLFGFAGLGVALVYGINIRDYLVHIANWNMILAALFAILLRYFLVKYVGDIAVYTNADAKAKNYSARCAILNGATEAITRLLKDKNEYQEIIIAGHSLGSVIAYDALNQLFNQNNSAPDQLAPGSPIPADRLDRIKGLVTFGSPLDKVYYFFREVTREDQAVRAQLLSYLHWFRRIRSGRDYGSFMFKTYSNKEPIQLRWLNAWSVADPVSGHLHYYRVDEQKRFLGISHLGYWEDPKFYSFVAEKLLMANRAMAAQA